MTDSTPNLLNRTDNHTCPTCGGHIETPHMEEPASTFAKVLGITDIPTEPKNGTVGRVKYCRELLRQADSLPTGKALMVEFETRRDREICRPILHRLIKYLEPPYSVRVIDTIMWVCKTEASHE